MSSQVLRLVLLPLNCATLVRLVVLDADVHLTHGVPQTPDHLSVVLVPQAALLRVACIQHLVAALRDARLEHEVEHDALNLPDRVPVASLACKVAVGRDVIELDVRVVAAVGAPERDLDRAINAINNAPWPEHTEGLVVGALDSKFVPEGCDKCSDVELADEQLRVVHLWSEDQMTMPSHWLVEW